MIENSNNWKNQTGLVLVVVLLLVPVMFMLSYTAISKLTFGERITTNVADQNHAFYAAETAIADAEAWMASGKEPFVHDFKPTVFSRNGGEYSGLYSVPTKMDKALAAGNVIVLGTAGTVSSNTKSVPSGNKFFDVYRAAFVAIKKSPPPKNINSTESANSSILTTPLSRQPVFIIEMVELLPCTPPMTHNRAVFKVTARGWGVATTTVVTLETFFSLKFQCNGVDGDGVG